MRTGCGPVSYAAQQERPRVHAVRAPRSADVSATSTAAQLTPLRRRCAFPVHGEFAKANDRFSVPWTPSQSNRLTPYPKREGADR